MSIINQAVAARLAILLRTQRVIWSGCFNSNGLRGSQFPAGMVPAVANQLMANGIKIFGAGPTTMLCTDASTGANANNNNPFGSGGHGALWGRVGTSGAAATPNSILNSANVLDHYVEAPELAKRYHRPRANDATSLQYSGIYRPLAFRNVSVVGASQSASGINIDANPTTRFQIDRNRALTYDTWHGDASTNGGTICPVAYDGPAFANTHIANAGVVTIPAGTPATMVRTTLSVPAGTRQAFFRVAPTASITSPVNTIAGRGVANADIFYGYGLLFETDTMAGAIVAPFSFQGGWSCYDFAHSLNRTDADRIYDEALDHWFDVMCRPAIAAGQDPVMVWQFQDGSNQTTETLPSYVGGFTADSTAAYQDNLLAACQRVLSRWIAKGFKSQNLIFCFVPDHPRPGTDNDKQAAYRSVGIPYICDRLPFNSFGYNADQSITFAELLNAGVGNNTYLSGQSGTQAVTAVSTPSAGNVTLNVVNSYAANDWVVITGTNSTPPVDGVYQLVSRTGTTIVIANNDVDIAGTAAGTCRQLDTFHLSVAGHQGGVLNGYDLITSRMMREVFGSGLGSGPGAVNAQRYRGRGNRIQ